MAPRSLLFVASAFVGAALVAAQAAPNWQYIPVACQDQCAQTVESSYLCSQKGGSGTAVYGCFCDNYPSDADGCASCLTSNDAAALGQLLTSTQTDCPAQQKSCNFACAFETCDSKDVACQCDGSYLQNIFNCATCNTDNNNPGTTTVTDFNALKDSCAKQNYTGAQQDFSPVTSVSIDAGSYQAPTLTATGGGEAATGDVQATDGALAAGGASGGSATAASPAAATTSPAAAAASTVRSTTRSPTSAGAAVVSASGRTVASSGAAGAAGAVASATPTGGAGALGVPALAGVLGLAGAVAALF